jgi:hypothetical protein
VKLNFGPGMESRTVVTAWDLPRMVAREADGWTLARPPIATEFSVEARAVSALSAWFKASSPARRPSPINRHSRTARFRRVI